ncbi:hypothetical protein G9464_03810 [Halostella sp. JP-L12]|uniref:DUF6276 family protein n=1 Tax=Halostella TaxID=1843185 RepID=UPI000EF75D00|nr:MULTISPECIES: DUF6276 family protein [Halostella]NHN46722.1 hypothetical protein [Halostella sp. JP-L12]
MDCPDCGAPTVAFSVSPDLRECAPGDGPAAAICTDCLAVLPAAEPADDPAFDDVSGAFPSGPAAVPTALLVGLLSSLAVNRDAIERLVGRVEAAGADPLLVVDRLAADPDLSPAVDLDRRRHQLEQLL